MSQTVTQAAKDKGVETTKSPADIIRSLDSMVRSAKVAKNESQAALALRAAAW